MLKQHSIETMASARHYQVMQMLKPTASHCKLRQSTTLDVHRGRHQKGGKMHELSYSCSQIDSALPKSIVWSLWVEKEDD